YEYTGDPATDLDVLVYGDELIFAAPYYIIGTGFVNENLLLSHFDTVELETIYSVIDSIFIVVDDEQPELAVQQLISNGKTRILGLSHPNTVGLINGLSQMSHSVALAYELDQEY